MATPTSTPTASTPTARGSADGEIWDAFLAEVGLTDACTESECEDPGRIDKVAYRTSDTITLAVTAYDVPSETFSDPAGDPLSDHEPVAVTFTWSATP